MILGKDEEEILSEKIGTLNYKESEYENGTAYLTNKRFIVEGEQGGGLLSDAETSTVIEVPLTNIRNVSEQSGGFLKSSKIKLEFDKQGFPTFHLSGVEDPQSWKNQIEKAVSEVI